VSERGRTLRTMCTTEDDRKSRPARAGELHRFPRDDDLPATGNFFRSRGPRRWRKNPVECCPAAIIPALAGGLNYYIYIALRHYCAYIPSIKYNILYFYYLLLLL